MMVDRTSGDASAFMTPAMVTLFFALFGSFAVPRAAPFAFALMVIVLVLGGQRAVSFRPDWKRGDARLLLLLFVANAYCLSTAAWSIDPVESAKASIVLALYSISVPMAIRALSGLSRDHLSTARIVCAAALCAGALFVCFEAVSAQLITRTAVSFVPLLRSGGSAHFKVEGGWITQIDPFVLKRNSGALCILAWPVILAWQSSRPAGPLRTSVIAATLALVFAAALLTAHDAAMIAIGASATTFSLARRFDRTARIAVLSAWLVGCALIVPIMQTAYQVGLYRDSALPWTARARIILWGYTANQVASRPLVGIGAAATKEYSKRHLPIAARPADHIYPLSTAPHAHNIFLQVWFELGALGATLLALIGALILSETAQLNRAERPFALASFVSAVAITSFTWSIWQEWFLALLFAAPILVCLGSIQNNNSNDTLFDETMRRK